MATIGFFRPTDEDGFTGEIGTLSLRARHIRIVADPHRASDKAPTHRVLCGRVEIGAGWPPHAGEGRARLRLKLDDPGLPAPLYASLVEPGPGETAYPLIWSRRPASAD